MLSRGQGMELESEQEKRRQRGLMRQVWLLVMDWPVSGQLAAVDRARPKEMGLTLTFWSGRIVPSQVQCSSGHSAGRREQAAASRRA
jgi:hypothetical protein